MHKAAGADIMAEWLKALDENGMKFLINLGNEIYKTGVIPKDISHSIFIPIPKKSKATRCEKFRKISLISQLSKILLCHSKKK